MDGYKEGKAYFPFTYSDLDYQLTTAYVGLNYEHKISERLKWSIAGEVEQDLAHNDPGVHVSADYIGAFEFNPDLAHKRASAPTTLSYAVAEDVSIGLTDALCDNNIST